MHAMQYFALAHTSYQLSISGFEPENGLTGIALPASENKVFNA